MGGGNVGPAAPVILWRAGGGSHRAVREIRTPRSLRASRLAPGRSALDSWPVLPTLPLMPAWPRLSPQSCITGPGPFSLGLPEEIKRDPGNLSFLSNDLPELGGL